MSSPPPHAPPRPKAPVLLHLVFAGGVLSRILLKLWEPRKRAPGIRGLGGPVAVPTWRPRGHLPPGPPRAASARREGGPGRRIPGSSGSTAAGWDCPGDGSLRRSRSAPGALRVRVPFSLQPMAPCPPPRGPPPPNPPRGFFPRGGGGGAWEPSRSADRAHPPVTLGPAAAAPISAVTQVSDRSLNTYQSPALALSFGTRDPLGTDKRGSVSPQTKFVLPLGMQEPRDTRPSASWRAFGGHPTCPKDDVRSPQFPTYPTKVPLHITHPPILLVNNVIFH